MVATPNTLGVVLFMVVTFVGCILWATHGVQAHHDSKDEDLHGPSKPV